MGIAGSPVSPIKGMACGDAAHSEMLSAISADAKRLERK
jgi:hypothetical protein